VKKKRMKKKEEFISVLSSKVILVVVLVYNRLMLVVVGGVGVSFVFLGQEEKMVLEILLHVLDSLIACGFCPRELETLGCQPSSL
jgi:hypothetical protein